MPPRPALVVRDSMAVGRYGFTASLLPSDEVLVLGGQNGGAVSTAEVYTP
ncbi:hypothetical protein [Sorangium sp. So ce131]